MRRLLTILLVGLLCVMTSDVFALVVPDRCAAEVGQAAPVDDGACSPTCLRCHCARPFDVVTPLQFAAAALDSVQWLELVQTLPLPTPHDVLHVPRPPAA